MSAFDDLTARFRKAVQPVQPALPEPARSARGDEGPDADVPRTPPAAVITVAATAGTPSRARPRRRRWLPPTSPAERDQQPVVEPQAGLHLCPFCNRRHQPVQLHSTGMAALAARRLDWRDDPYR